jgi:hypothetical protein
VCERLVNNHFTGLVVLEVSTRRARTRHDRAALLAESLLFARLNLQPSTPLPVRPNGRDVPGRPAFDGGPALAPVPAQASAPGPLGAPSRP